MNMKLIKKAGILFALILVISTMIPIRSIPAQAKAKVKLNHKKMTMQTGDWKKLKIKNLSYEIEDIKWSTDNKGVAKVSRKGWVVALVKGECTITAEVLATGKKYSCKVTVEAPDATQRVIDPEKPIIALSFDDGPGIYTADLLETLKSYGVTATFFMCNDNGGSNKIAAYADLIRDMYNSGCEVANHTMKHPQLTKLSSSGMVDEISGNRKKIEAVIGTQDRMLLRPPYGAYNDTVKSVAEAPLILWSVDTLDWKVKGQSNATELILAEVKKEAYDGGIILMHDIHKTSVEAVGTVVSWLIQQGYQVCSVSEMFEARGEELENGVAYSRCISAAKYKEKQ